MPENKIWKVIDIINWGKDYLSEKKISEPRLNIELLLCKIIDCKRFGLYLNFDKPLTADELAKFKELLKRRLNFEPLQYILGETEFMGLPFKLNPSVLIPRPETELLVEECIHHSENFNKKIIHILDIGAGSGNIAISLAKLIPNAQILSVDINNEIIRTAAENAELNKVSDKITFKIQDILKEDFQDTEKFDIIISNPPYISKSEYLTLQQELKFEPEKALTDFSDGLTFYKKISGIAPNLLNKDGFILLEIAYNQGESVKKLFTDSIFKTVIIKKDYSNLDRILFASIEPADQKSAISDQIFYEPIKPEL